MSFVQIERGKSCNWYRLTIKSQEVVHYAQRLAEQYKHPEIDVEHLALALVEQEDGVVRPLLGRLGVSADQFKEDLAKTLSSRSDSGWLVSGTLSLPQSP